MILKIFTVLLSFLAASFSVSAQALSEKDFKIFDGGGKPASLSELSNNLATADVVFLGEQHDDATAHRLQFEIFKAAFEKYGKSRPILLSMEMFERDAQIVIDEYLRDLINEPNFVSAARAWNNYKTDYRPLVEFAKQNNLPVIAANAPRRYVNMVSRGGRGALNGLSPAAKNWIAPLPYGEPSRAYGDKFNALMGKMPEANMGLNKILASQSLWDATMAFSIAEYLKRTRNGLIVHLNGSFHTENRLGLPEHLAKFQPQARTLVVTMRREKDYKVFDKNKHLNAGDIVILTDAAQQHVQK